MTPAERKAAIRRYAAGPARLRAALRRVPKPALRWRPAPGEWSAHEVVHHCADSESNAQMRDTGSANCSTGFTHAAIDRPEVNHTVISLSR